jgi:hypothetical protein
MGDLSCYNPSVGFLVAKPEGVSEIDLNQAVDAKSHNP